jgi:3'(2'), 5'-bisphosphate nucleotidase
MPFHSHQTLADGLLPAVLEAGRIILEIRERGLIVDTKADRSPVTDADRLAEAILVAAIEEIHPNVPIVAEEQASAGGAPHASATLFLVDPLDGTRDYCAGRNDFTVNVGLIYEGVPAFGLIYAPGRGEFFVTTGPRQGVGASVETSSRATSLAELDTYPLAARRSTPGQVVALVSRSESGRDHAERVADLGATSTIGLSSAIKFCLLARGEADLYPRFGTTCEWDTAAGQAILEAAGGSMTNLDGTPMIYGKAAAGYRNGSFIARGGPPA